MDTYNKIIATYWNHLFKFNILIAIILVLIIRFVLESQLSPEQLNSWVILKTKDVYPIFATIAGTLLGFIITSISIIIAFTKSDIKFEIFRKSDQYKSLFGIYFDTIKILAITTIIALIGILANSGNILLFYISLVSIIVSSLFLWACIWAIEKIIGIVKE